MKTRLITLSFTLLSPVIALAAAARNYSELVGQAVKIVNQAIPVVFILTLLAFFWGVAQIVIRGADTKAVENGKNTMRVSVIAFTVFLSVWAIVNILLNTVFGSNAIENKPPFPDTTLPGLSQ